MDPSHKSLEYKFCTRTLKKKPAKSVLIGRFTSTSTKMVLQMFMTTNQEVKKSEVIL